MSMAWRRCRHMYMHVRFHRAHALVVKRALLRLRAYGCCLVTKQILQGWRLRIRERCRLYSTRLVSYSAFSLATGGENVVCVGAGASKARTGVVERLQERQREKLVPSITFLHF